MNRKVFLIIGIIAVVGCIACAGFFALVFGLGLLGTQPAADVGDSFMAALRDGNYDQAYTLCSPALQKELGSARNLETRVKNAGLQPTQWTFTSRNISGSDGQLDGSATLTGNREGTVRLVLTQVGNDWKISGFNLRQK